jgi:protein-S-isoprenylcysteine O-methyltransferase Ste14
LEKDTKMKSKKSAKQRSTSDKKKAPQQQTETKEEFHLTRRYVVSYWITFASYIVIFLILMISIGYAYNSPINNIWLKRLGLAILLAGWIIWYIGRRKLGHESIDIDPLGEIALLLFHLGAKRSPRYKKKLVNNGIYAITRHPQYWGTVLFFIGISLGLTSIPVLIASFVVILPTHIYRSKVEEKMMRKSYGKPYEEYLSSVKI